MKRFVFLLSVAIIFMAVGCAEDKLTGDYTTTCTVTSPTNLGSVPIGRFVTVTANGDKNTSFVEFYVDGEKKWTDGTPSNGFSFSWGTGISNQTVQIYAKAYDILGGSVFSATNTVQLTHNGSAAPGSDVPAYVETNAATWTLRWEDNFNAATIDSAKWSFNVGYGAGEGGPGWGNDEWQYYVTNAFYIGEGSLAISAVCPDGIPGQRNFTIFSGRMHTQGKFEFHYNNVGGNTGSAVKVMARIKAPYSKGVFPAFWMLGTSFDLNGSDNHWPECGEIDILEITGGGSHDNIALFNVHWQDGGGQRSYVGSNYMNASKLSDDYHVYEVEWSGTQIIGRIDGITYFTKTLTADMEEFKNKDFFILINMAFGGILASSSEGGGVPDSSTVFPQTMYVDWVRVYQKN